jgi:hypothetical protein
MSRLYGSVNIDVDVDLSDIYDNMSRSQKTEFADKLQDDGFLNVIAKMMQWSLKKV